MSSHYTNSVFGLGSNQHEVGSRLEGSDDASEDDSIIADRENFRIPSRAPVSIVPNPKRVNTFGGFSTNFLSNDFEQIDHIHQNNLFSSSGGDQLLSSNHSQNLHVGANFSNLHQESHKELSQILNITPRPTSGISDLTTPELPEAYFDHLAGGSNKSSVKSSSQSTTNNSHSWNNDPSASNINMQNLSNINNYKNAYSNNTAHALLGTNNSNTTTFLKGIYDGNALNHMQQGSTIIRPPGLSNLPRATSSLGLGITGSTVPQSNENFLDSILSPNNRPASTPLYLYNNNNTTINNTNNNSLSNASFVNSVNTSNTSYSFLQPSSSSLSHTTTTANVASSGFGKTSDSSLDDLLSSLNTLSTANHVQMSTTAFPMNQNNINDLSIPRITTTTSLQFDLQLLTSSLLPATAATTTSSSTSLVHDPSTTSTLVPSDSTLNSTAAAWPIPMRYQYHQQHGASTSPTPYGGGMNGQPPTSSTTPTLNNNSFYHNHNNGNGNSNSNHSSVGNHHHHGNVFNGLLGTSNDSLNSSVHGNNGNGNGNGNGYNYHSHLHTPTAVQPNGTVIIGGRGGLIGGSSTPVLPPPDRPGSSASHLLVGTGGSKSPSLLPPYGGNQHRIASPAGNTAAQYLNTSRHGHGHGGFSPPPFTQQQQQQQQHGMQQRTGHHVHGNTPNTHHPHQHPHHHNNHHNPHNPHSNPLAAQKLSLHSLDERAIANVILLNCYHILSDAASHGLKAVELANTLRARVGTEVLALVRERWGGLLSLLEQHPEQFTVERVPKNDRVLLTSSASTSNSTSTSGMKSDSQGGEGSRGDGNPSTEQGVILNGEGSHEQEDLSTAEMLHRENADTAVTSTTTSVLMDEQATLAQSQSSTKTTHTVDSNATSDSSSASTTATMNSQTPSRCLHVGNVPSHFTDMDLANEFEKFGTIEGIKLVIPKNQSRRFAFITFQSIAEAVNAKQQLSKSYPWKSAISFAHKELANAAAAAGSGAGGAGPPTSTTTTASTGASAGMANHHLQEGTAQHAMNHNNHRGGYHNTIGNTTNGNGNTSGMHASHPQQHGTRNHHQGGLHPAGSGGSGGGGGYPHVPSSHHNHNNTMRTPPPHAGNYHNMHPVPGPGHMMTGGQEDVSIEDFPAREQTILQRLCDDTYVPTQPWPHDEAVDRVFVNAIREQILQFGGNYTTTISKLRGFLKHRIGTSSNIKSVPLKALLQAYPHLFQLSGNVVSLCLNNTMSGGGTVSSNGPVMHHPGHHSGHHSGHHQSQYHPHHHSNNTHHTHSSTQQHQHHPYHHQGNGGSAAYALEDEDTEE